MNNGRTAISVFLLAFILIFPSSPQAESKSEKTDEKKAATKKEGSKKELLSRRAKIKIGKAERIAQKKVPGKTQEIELELENGQLIYSVEIETTDGTKEVSIDAISGEIIKIENDDDDETQKASDEKQNDKENGKGDEDAQVKKTKKGEDSTD